MKFIFLVPGRFDEIVAKDCESKVAAGTRTLFRVIRQLGTNENAGGLVKLADVVKKELEEFLPFVPLVVAMRNQGMRDRHWAQISEITKKTVNPEMVTYLKIFRPFRLL